MNDFDTLRGFVFDSSPAATAAAATTKDGLIAETSQTQTGNHRTSATDGSTTTRMLHKNVGGSWKTTRRRMDMSSTDTGHDNPPETTNLDVEDAEESTERSSTHKQNLPADPSNQNLNQNPNDNRTLLIELTNNILQLKELEVTCRTTIEQTIIEYETKLDIAFNSKEGPGAKQLINIHGGQFPRGYQTPLQKIRGPSTDPSRSQRNKLSNHNYANHHRPESISTSSSASSSSSAKLIDTQYTIVIFFMALTSIYNLHLSNPLMT